MTGSKPLRTGKKTPAAQTPPNRRQRGFEAAGHLAQGAITEGARKRGAMLVRLITHWGEIAGEDLGAITRPLRSSFGRDGLGATLTLAAAPAMAPVIQMRLPDLVRRINAALGYAAVARIKLLQSDAGAFAERPAVFDHAPTRTPPPPPPAEVAQVTDPGLRAALETLARNVQTRTRNNGAPR